MARIALRGQAGIVLHSGQFPIRLGDRLWALPISTLWQAPQ